MQPVSRDVARRLGNETRQLLAAGRYTAPSGRVVYVRDDLAAAVEGTVTHAPGDDLSPLPTARPHRTRITTVNGDALAVAERHGEAAAVLNFASATRPGGGWLVGARAQEESLARSSGLVPCITGSSMYDHNRRRNDPLYTDHVIYSPAVPVFRDHLGALREAPFRCGFLTAAAPNLRHLPPRRRAEVAPAMRLRIERVLHVAAHHGHTALVLGAWGCGAFRNSPSVIAGLFDEALAEVDGLFAEVTFAVLDWSPERRFIGPFAKRWPLY